MERRPGDKGLFSRTRSWRSVFLLTFMLRTYFSLSPSYIHPDEHFQGPEAIADKVFGWATKASWEFTSDEPARSYVLIWLSYGLPMTMLQALLSHAQRIIDPLQVLNSLRLAFALGTWVLSDMAIDRLSDTKEDKIKGLFFVATSYVTWTYQSHTFSNSVETVILLWCLVIIHEFTNGRATDTGVARHWDIALLGFFVVAGVFNRVTFPAFLLIPLTQLSGLFRKYPATLVSFIASLGMFSFAAVYVDTLLYGSDTSALSNYVVAPLNNLLYNTQLSNLNVHGIHSRFQHILVNVPELLGPGILFLASTRYLRSLPLQAAVSGIAVLSIVPHQEPRFLVPVVPLLCWCFNPEIYSPVVAKYLLGFWLVFNMAMGVLMGIFHQGGVIPAQSYIGRSIADHAFTVTWWKTYSPPIWLLGRPSGSVEVLDPVADGQTTVERYGPMLDYLHNNLSMQSPAQYRHSLTPDALDAPGDTLSVIDLMGADHSTVIEVLDAIKQASQFANDDDLRKNYFVAPVSQVYGPGGLHEAVNGSYTFTEVWSTLYHLSLDDVDLLQPTTLHPGLKIWQID